MAIMITAMFFLILMTDGDDDIKKAVCSCLFLLGVWFFLLGALLDFGLFLFLLLGTLLDFCFSCWADYVYFRDGGGSCRQCRSKFHHHVVLDRPT